MYRWRKIDLLLLIVVLACVVGAILYTTQI